MLILVPLSKEDTQEGVVVSLNEASTMAEITMENSSVVEINFYNGDIEEKLQTGEVVYLVISDLNDDVELFFDYNVGVLSIDEPNATIDDVTEAFMFRTLRDVN